MAGDEGWSRPTGRRDLTRAGTLLRQGEVARAFAVAHEVAATAKENADERLALDALSVEADLLLSLGRVEDVLTLALDAAEALARRPRTPSSGFAVRGVVAEAALELGDVDLGARVLDPAAPGGGSLHPRFTLASARLRLILGAGSGTGIDATDHPTAKQDLPAWTFRVEATWWSRGPAAALALVQDVPLELATSADTWATLQFATTGLRVCADLGASTTGDGESRLALDVADALVRLVDARDLAEARMAASRTTRAAEEADWLAERARLRHYAPLSSWWLSAAERWQAHGRPHREAYARWRLSQALADEGDQQGATEQLRRADATARSHGPLLRQVRATASRLGAASEPAPQDGLTPREREVMDLAASGLTSAGVGHRLGISPRTVGKHLENAYTKLGTNNRVSALRRFHGQDRPGEAG
ncbi:helix-turn-helix transcriptional regulator [Microlunatus flavus]|uniref:Regulatory protein, luxR family n=1 Tax=Microlunatus flavus TaxID=1036181 RepID=A0A1H9FM84_9ACTN|nr:helix-turn-helix transcriptional regulator [Microlunatus flavus]SEQ38949.1 regulatory protein, luxR family [Microlunatus flavus]